MSSLKDRLEQPANIAVSKKKIKKGPLLYNEKSVKVYEGTMSTSDVIIKKYSVPTKYSDKEAIEQRIRTRMFVFMPCPLNSI